MSGYETRTTVKPGTGEAFIKTSTGTNLTYPFSYNRETSSVYSWRGQRRKRDRYGWDPPNPFSLNRFKVKYGTCNVGRVSRYGVKYSASGYYLPKFRSELQLSSMNLTTLSNRAISMMESAQHKAYADANGPDCPGLTWIGEFRETFSMLLKAGWSVIKLTIRAKSRIALINKIASIKEKADQIADVWLTWRYGVMPLLLQIADILELINERKSQLETSTGYTQLKEQTRKDVLTLTVFYQKMIFELVTEIKLVGACKLYPSALKERDYGFKPHDALSAAWEFLTLSFVVDWFIGIGDWIGAFRPGNAAIAHQTNTYVVDVTRTIGLKSHTNTDQTSKDAWAVVRPSVAKDSIVIRNINQGIDSVLPKFNAEALSLNRQLDAIALVFKTFGGMRRK